MVEIISLPWMISNKKPVNRRWNEFLKKDHGKKNLKIIFSTTRDHEFRIGNFRNGDGKSGTRKRTKYVRN